MPCPHSDYHMRLDPSVLPARVVSLSTVGTHTRSTEPRGVDGDGSAVLDVTKRTGGEPDQIQEQFASFGSVEKPRWDSVVGNARDQTLTRVVNDLQEPPGPPARFAHMDLLDRHQELG